MLARNGHRSRDGQRQRAALADGVVENRINPAQESAAEGGETVRDEIVEAIAFVDALYVDAAPGGIGRLPVSGRVAVRGFVVHQT
jgi:hypothetical protein